MEWPKTQLSCKDHSISVHIRFSHKVLDIGKYATIWVIGLDKPQSTHGIFRFPFLVY